MEKVVNFQASVGRNMASVNRIVGIVFGCILIPVGGVLIGLGLHKKNTNSPNPNKFGSNPNAWKVYLYGGIALVVAGIMSILLGVLLNRAVRSSKIMAALYGTNAEIDMVHHLLGHHHRY